MTVDVEQDTINDGTGGRRRNDASRSLNRRVVMKAAAGVSALAATGIGLAGPSLPAVAQEVGGTRARRWVAADNGGGFRAASSDPWTIFAAEYEFFALGASWDGGVGTWPVVELQLSEDGETWSEDIQLVANTDDGGQPSRDGRLFTSLAFTTGALWVRYRTVDTEGTTGDVAGLSFVYIDASDGPWDADIAPEAEFTTAAVDTYAPPEIVNREQWGANERYRFDSFGEVWPPEYETVSHVIIHHTATANRPADVAGAIRSIYYYHAIEQGWGDIGYNYLVDHNGRIYQGRWGGQNVIGGHAYQYAIGSSGISTIGNFQTVDISSAARAALVSITAFVARDLDPNGRADFHEAPDLPIISSHRDVNSTTCPGDFLWADLPEIRDLVAATLDQGDLDTGLPGGITIGDRIKVQTDDGTSLNVRQTPRGNIIDSLGNGKTAYVVDGPDTRYDGNWFRIEWAGGTRGGWAIAKYMIIVPFPPPASDEDDYVFGLNMRFTSETNVRSQPTTSSSIRATVPRNTWAAILAGPTYAGGYEWYQVSVYGYSGGWVVKANITPAPVNQNPTAKFRVGDTVTTTSSVNVRPRPGVAQKVITTENAGATLKITQPALSVTNYIWYGVFNDRIGGGYIVENYIRLGGTTPPPTGGKFDVGDSVRVTESLNLRSGPSTSSGVIAVLPAGTTGTVKAGPRSGSGYTWYQIQTSSGTGWAVQDWLAASGGTSGTTPPPTGKFRINDLVRVTESLNLRTSASTSASVISVLPAGTDCRVLAGPRTGSGYTWWQIRTTNYGTGWAVQDWLTKISGASAASTGFSNGDSVTVFDGALNLRTSGSLSASVAAVLPDGHALTIIGGPITSDGYTWYQVRSGTYGTGWVVSVFIR